MLSVRYPETIPSILCGKTKQRMAINSSARKKYQKSYGILEIGNRKQMNNVILLNKLVIIIIINYQFEQTRILTKCANASRKTNKKY